MSSLNTTEIDYLLTRLGAAVSPSAYGEFLLKLGKRVGVAGEFRVSDYPNEPGGRPLKLFYDRVDKDGHAYKSKFKSLKQQRKVFALFAEGKIPYRRTGKLGASITSRAELTDGGVLVRIGTKYPGAQFMIGVPELQSHYHQETGWQSLPVQIGTPEATAAYQQILTEGLRSYLLGALGGTL